MASSNTDTYFVIKNQNGEFLEFLPYNGLRIWVTEFNDRCKFANQNAATLYCRSLIADSKVNGVEVQIDVYKHNNTVTELDVEIPKEQLKMYGVPEENFSTSTEGGEQPK